MEVQKQNLSQNPLDSTSTFPAKDMLGKVVLVTGASSGIGLVTACELAKRGAKVILLCRDEERGKLALEKVHLAASNQESILLLADLSSLDSVRNAAQTLLQSQTKIDVLINNAGLSLTKRHQTIDGYEEVFAVNHLAHFLLTHLLLPLLKAAPHARIINVSSMAHRSASMQWDDLQFQHKFSSWKVYSQSKLANILFTRALAKRLTPDGITVNCLHPGVVATGFARDFPSVLRWLMGLFSISVEKGARTSVYLAASPEVSGITGGYFVNGKLKAPSARAQSEADAERLWSVSEKLVGFVPEHTSQ